jgi:Uma2 family endonuclease
MSSAVQKIPFITVEEYLEGEKLADVRHEYVDGQVYAMSGASDRHNSIAGEAYALLKSHLRGGECRSYLLDLKVGFQEDGSHRFYYPDVFVTCDPEDADPYVKTRPKLIIEVLSPSTWRTDRGEKAETYRRIPSVEEIVLIAQDWPELTVFRRSDGWQPHTYTLLESVIRFDSVDFEAPLSAFYESTPFPPDVARPWYLQDRAEG